MAQHRVEIFGVQRRIKTLEAWSRLSYRVRFLAKGEVDRQRNINEAVRPLIYASSGGINPSVGLRRTEIIRVVAQNLRSKVRNA